MKNKLQLPIEEIDEDAGTFTSIASESNSSREDVI